MLEIDPNELVTRFRQPGGGDWVNFSNNLLWAACWQAHIPESEVRTCLRTEIPDGGVDTRINRCASHDSTGYLSHPSIWQFKAANEASLTPVSLRAEVNKSFASDRIRRGDAYRLCLCAHLADENKTALETALSAATSELNAAAPPPKILTADDIGRWASHFPSFVHEFRGLEVQGGTLILKSWGDNAEARTKVFIPSAKFELLRDRILGHIDLDVNVKDPVLALQGPAGIGKTRIAYESLKSFQAANGLVLYADNEQEALKIARIVAGISRTACILVVDDCSVSGRYDLTQLLQGHKHRIRAVVIHHDSEAIRSASPELSVNRYSDHEIEAILRENYPGTPPEHLRAYIQLSEGYLRLAIDLCEHDFEIAQAQGTGPADPTVEIYYRRRLGADTDFVDGLALFTRVGRDGDVHEELDALCKWLGFNRLKLEQRLAELKDSPGFVERSAIYYRVTPEIIAMRAFDSAWNKWARGRENRFLEEVQALPDTMQKSFMMRASRSASSEVREIVRDFFQSFAQRFTGADLGDIDKILQLINLIEINPDHYFPTLCRVVERASDDELKAAPRSFSGWGPRRQLVFIADKMAQFTVFVRDAETLLYRLARIEIEPDLGNNATETWQRLFRPQLSGTPVPFLKRIEWLRERIPPPSQPLDDLHCGALKKLFEYWGTRVLGSALVAGRIPDPQWRFRSQMEINDAVSATLRLLFDTAQSRRGAPKSDNAYELLLQAIGVYVRQGYLDLVKAAIAVEELPNDVQADLHTQFEDVSGSNSMRLPDALHDGHYPERVKEWLSTFSPQDLIGRVIKEVSRSSWEHHHDNSEWRKRLSLLAKEFLDSYRETQEKFREVESWLLSDKSRGAFQFGLEVGKIDRRAILFDWVIESAANTRSVEFGRGYIFSCTSNGFVSAEILNDILDRLQANHPLTVFYLAHSIGDRGHVFDRTVDMVRKGQLHHTFLRNFTVWIGDRRTTPREVGEALRELIPLIKRGVQGSADIAIDFVAYQYHSSPDLPSRFDLDTDFERMAWEVVDVAPLDERSQGFGWDKIVENLSKTSKPKRVASLLVRTLLGENYHLKESAENLLSAYAKEQPLAVLEALGEMMCDETKRWAFHIEKMPVFVSLPHVVIAQWLDERGVEAALCVARHVPAPFLDSEDRPSLHPLTELILSKFEDSDEVFSEFAAGVHSFQPYIGDIAGHKEREAARARKFLNHPLRRVREWAHYEIASAQAQATSFRESFDKLRE